VEPAYTRITSSKWVVDVAIARALVAGGAIVLDARRPDLKGARPLSNAVSVAWQDFTNEDATTRGRLLGDDALLTKRLQALGISKGVAVLVLADAKMGGGEDGRLAWTLRTLGHPSVFVVDGGIDALARGGLPAIKPPPTSGDFVVSRDRRFEIMKEELRASLGSLESLSSMCASRKNTPERRLTARAVADMSRGRSISSTGTCWTRMGMSCPASRSGRSFPKSE